MSAHPLREALNEWLPQVDFAVLSHGFAPHGRDYVFVLQARGTYELVLSHVVELQYQTRVRDDVWPMSWDDTFLDYELWEAAGAPDGYVWGTNWSMAEADLTTPEEDPQADAWALRLAKPMFAFGLETDRFRLSLIFHSARYRKLSEDSSLVDRIIVPLAT
jgi:hypothetical protein